MRLFGRGDTHCAVCKKEITHRHKPKREWNIKGSLCGDCHVDKTKEYFEAKVRQPCVVCGTTKKISDLWEPRWQWDMDGLVCKTCFDAKESEHHKEKNFCSICGAKMGFIRYNPKGKWKIAGQLCRTCWDEQKAKMGCMAQDCQMPVCRQISWLAELQAKSYMLYWRDYQYAKIQVRCEM